MKLRTVNGIHYADYQDGTAAVACADLSEMWGRVFEKLSVDRVLGRCVTSHKETVGRLVGGKKKVRITVNAERGDSPSVTCGDSSHSSWEPKKEKR